MPSVATQVTALFGGALMVLGVIGAIFAAFGVFMFFQAWMNQNPYVLVHPETDSALRFAIGSIVFTAGTLGAGKWLIDNA